jgi:hypothetical protein
MGRRWFATGRFVAFEEGSEARPKVKASPAALNPVAFGGGIGHPGAGGKGRGVVATDEGGCFALLDDAKAVQTAQSCHTATGQVIGMTATEH